MRENITLNNKRVNLIIFAAIAACTALLGLQLQDSQAYAFFYRESQQLLFLDGDYLRSLILQFGGLGTFLSQFLVQFFVHAGVGAIVTAILSGISAWMLWLVVRKMSNNWALLPLTFLPALIQVIYLVTAYHHYEGLVAICVANTALWLYSLCSNLDYRYRLAIGSAMAFALYLGFGPIALLFSACALVFDTVQRNEKWYLAAIYLFILIVAGSYMVSNGTIIDYEFAYGPKFYYEFYVVMTPFLYMAWVATMAVMAVAFAAKAAERFLSKWVNAALLVVLTLSTAGYYIQHHTATSKAGVYYYMELYHHMVTENWDAILAKRDLNYQIPLNINFVNLALSKKGELLDKLFYYPQTNVSSLLNEQMGTFVEEHSVYSEIYYHLGIVSQTLELSLAAMAGTYPGTPLLLQQFIRSRIVMGDYDLAEKLVYRLEQTYAYKDWAKAQRQFLHNDAAVEADAEYGPKRRNLPDLSSEFVSMNGLLYDLLKVFEANPDNTVARDYVIACMLLSKNFEAIHNFVETYYNTPALQTIPTRLQEAILTYSERDMDYCRKHGVSEQTINRFAQFRQKVLTLRHQQPNANVKSQLSEFRDTFWYFML